MKTFHLFALLACVSLSPTVAAEKPTLSVAKLVVALKPDKNPDAMLAEKQQLADFLKAQVGKPTEVIIPLSTAAILEGFTNGTVDLAYLSATDLVAARERKVADLLLAGEIEGKMGYQSYWVTLKEKPYTKIDDLRGKPAAFASRTSTSGFVVPLYDLNKRGLVSATGKPEEFFGKGNVFYGSGYVSAIERVLSGDAEAAAVSYYVLDKDKHLTVEQRGKLRKLQEQGPVPTHVLAVRSNLPAADQATLKAALLTLNEPANEALRDKLFTSKLVPSDADKHLAGLTEALALARKGAE